MLLALLILGRPILAVTDTLARQPVKKPVEVSVPAIFSQYLIPPGKLNNVKEPGRILFDPTSKELYIADLGNNRILIFDSNNVYRFSFLCHEHVYLPSDVAVTREGYFYVLGANIAGKRVVKFDFDGLHMTTFDLSAIIGNSARDISSMAVGADGKVYLLDEVSHQIIIIDSTGKFVTRFEVVKFMEGKDKLEMIYGAIFLHDSSLYIPLAAVGTVAVYTLNGRYLRSIGNKGGATGELNFPVAVSINMDGIVHVLDSGRFNVVCFTQTGKFVGEFGGKGFSPGWFYMPNRIAINANNDIVIGQVMNNRIQVCKPPPFLYPENSLNK